MVILKLNKNLATRESARVLFSYLLKKDVEVLDFKDVVVVSRSFANEFSKLEKDNDVNFKKINMKKDVKFMFENSSKKIDSDVLSKVKYSTISLKSYSSLI